MVISKMMQISHTPDFILLDEVPVVDRRIS